ncbi:MAG: TIGR03792 family protein [Anaerolineae bacterium]|nr:TIGR03792 family protein [Anaerolineae bacterium]
MVIELLKFSIPTDECDLFVQRNEAVWAKGLREHTGFIKHEVWRDCSSPTDIYIAIDWATYEDWKSFPLEKIKWLDAQMGGNWPAVGCLELDVILHDDEVAVQHPDMIVEFLKFSIPDGEGDAFVQRNEAVWTAELRRHPCFIRHEIWRNRIAPQEVYLAIYLKSYESLQQFPMEKIPELDAQMRPHWLPKQVILVDVLVQ